MAAKDTAGRRAAVIDFTVMPVNSGGHPDRS